MSGLWTLIRGMAAAGLRLLFGFVARFLRLARRRKGIRSSMLTAVVGC